jgi:hypothetical protein
MYNLVNINNIFSLGFRCNNDDFLIQYLNVRKYSSPFSYMVIDIKTALSFIDNKFENYLSKDFLEVGKGTYKFNKAPWYCYFVHKCSIITDDFGDILDMDKLCLWVHHDVSDQNVINSINRRSLHLLNCLSEKPDTTLLFYIEKVQKYEGEKCYFDKNILDKYNCNFLILIPLLDFNADPALFYDNSQIRIIYFNSNLGSFGAEISSHPEEWSKIQILINKLYNFNIEDRPDT